MHDPRYDDDFRDYERTLRRAQRLSRELSVYLMQLQQVLAAMPQRKADATHLDLDNIEQIEGDLADAVFSVCDWPSLDLELSRFGLHAKQPTTVVSSPTTQEQSQ